MDIFVGVIVGLLVLMALVTAHEFGHFIMARRNGVKVLEFGIGFPPRAIAWVKDPKTKKWKRIPRKDWKKPQDDLIFSLNWLPIGGFCQMDGESAEDERKGTFGKASFWAKTKILFGGVMMNWLVAIIIFTILAWTGMPEFLDNQFTIPSDTRTVSTPVQIAEVAEDSPADKAGLKANDYIVSIDGMEMIHASEITDYNEEHAGNEVVYRIRREYDTHCPDDCPECDCISNHKVEEQDYKITLNTAESEYLLGVTMKTSQALSYSTWSAPIVGVGLTAQLTGETFKGVGIMLWNLISGIGSQFSFDASVRETGQAAISSVGDSVSGPVGIIGVLFPAFTSAGPTNLAFLGALISVSLACMNVLPIPALDGGRWLLIAIFKARKKKLDKATEERIVSRAFMVLLALIFIVTILDIIRIAR
ncbi:site-2 protease family protein [Candidatus Saccharibacteria bacterium]|nr:site-2 protease family protein [Candidatus Saccharibacteria bacterium]MBQ3321072.1 site-2 protease family protein [Candidatus Saccharibacteria bacterium]